MKSLSGFGLQLPEDYAEFVELFRRHRKVGYKDIWKMMMTEATEEKLKSLE